jgi:peptide chain release factor 1
LADRERITSRISAIDSELCSPQVQRNPPVIKALTSERAHLSRVLQVMDSLASTKASLVEMDEALASGDPDLAQIAREDTPALVEREKQLSDELRRLLLPRDENDERNVIIEVRSGTGGEEAALFAADVFRMYSAYAARRGWKSEVLGSRPSERGGFKEIVFSLTGREVYSRMKYEAGVHRVQRVPETEASGRIHTSACTVAVLPEAEEVELDIRPEDLKIDVYRSTGPGGQSVNTTDSAVRITHLPTGLVVTCQDEKSQHKNKAKAMKVLVSRLMAHEREQIESQRAEARRSMVGSGDRSAKIRTYNFPQSRVTDHRIHLTLHNLDQILAGDLDAVIDALDRAEQDRLLAEMSAEPEEQRE